MLLRGFKAYLLVVVSLALSGCDVVGTLDERPDSRPSLAVGGTLAGGSIGEDQWKALVEKASNSVVKIQVKTCSNKLLGTGSGFKTGRYFITNKHVLEGAQRIVLITSQGDEIQVVRWALSTRDDLAIIIIDSPWLYPGLSIANSDPQPGDVVAAVGFPLGADKAIRRARIIEKSENQRISRTYALVSSALVQPGDSGGPLVDTSGKVVAVTTALDLQANVSLSVPSSRLLELISESKNLKFQRPCT